MFHPIDILLLVILFLGFVWGFTKGFVYMFFSLLAILISIFIAGRFSNLIASTLFKAENLKLGYVVCFIILFTLSYVLIKKVSLLADKIVDFLELDWLDAVAGGGIGILQFIIITGPIVNIILKSPFSHFIEKKEELFITPFVINSSSIIINFIIGQIKNISF